MDIEIRLASAADIPAIGLVRRAGWLAAYAGLIDNDIIERVTATGGDTAAPPPYRTTIVAVAPAADGTPAVVGYAAFGAERAVDSARPAGSLTTAGLAGEVGAGEAGVGAGEAGVGEVYAIYVAPPWWSTGAGRALFAESLGALRAAAFRRVVLWTLTGNARARRFYEKAGFAPDGATNILTFLGGVEELRYARDL
jgi:GNAT superfamily N-acetyltransferase